MIAVARAKPERAFTVLVGGRTEAEDQESAIAAVLRSFECGRLTEDWAFRAICRLAPKLAVNDPGLIWEALSGPGVPGDQSPLVDELALRRRRTPDHRPTG